MTTDGKLFDETVAQRQALGDLLGNLAPTNWDTESLCAGWRIREVVAHITMPYRRSALSIIGSLLRARGRFDVAADRIARLDASNQSIDDLLNDLRNNVNHRWKPPGGGQLGALSHDVIHGLDITEPLDVQPVSPPERVATVLANPKLHRAFKIDLDGYRLEATDADYTAGAAGRLIRLPVKDLLLITTGRRPLPSHQ